MHLNEGMQIGSQAPVDAEDDYVLLSLGILLGENSSKDREFRSEKPDGSVLEFQGSFKSDHVSSGDKSESLVAPSSTI